MKQIEGGVTAAKGFEAAGAEAAVKYALPRDCHFANLVEHLESRVVVSAINCDAKLLNEIHIEGKIVVRFKKVSFSSDKVFKIVTRVLAIKNIMVGRNSSLRKPIVNRSFQARIFFPLHQI